MLQPRAVLRQLLRALDAHVTSVAGNRQWRDHVLTSFRANAGLQDVQRQQALLLLAAEYAELIANIGHHQVGRRRALLTWLAASRQQLSRAAQGAGRARVRACPLRRRWCRHRVPGTTQQHACACVILSRQCVALPMPCPARACHPAPHQHLLATYNIGVDPDARNKRMVEATAARVGFKLPSAQPQEEGEAEVSEQQQQHQQDSRGG